MRVAWYLLDHHPGHIALLPVAVLGASMLVSYERAKAESLGFEAKGGLMERAERVVVLCAGLAFSFLLIPLLWLMLALTAATAVQRFVKVWRQANAAGRRPPPQERPVLARRSGLRPRSSRPPWRPAGERGGRPTAGCPARLATPTAPGGPGRRPAGRSVAGLAWPGWPAIRKPRTVAAQAGGATDPAGPDVPLRHRGAF